MSMQEPTDDQLDGLFRKSAEEFNAPFDPVAWQAVKSRLDTRDRLTIWEHLLRWGLPVLLLLVLTGGSWNAHRRQVTAGAKTGSDIAGRRSVPTNKVSLPDRPVSRGKQDADNSRRLLSKTVTRLAKSIDPVKIAVNQPGDERAGTGSTSVEKARSSRREGMPLIVSKNRQSITPEISSRTIRPDAPAALTKPTRMSEYVRPSSSTVSASAVKRSRQDWSAKAGRERSRQRGSKRTANRITAIFPAANYATESTQSFVKQRVTTGEITGKSMDKPQSGPGPLPAVDVNALSAHRFSVGASDAVSFAKLTGRPGKWPAPLLFTGREVTAPEILAKTERPASTQPVPSQKGLSVRFVVSPDLSAIGLRNFQRPGTNVGLLLEYRLASRWSVQAGVLQSTKVYKALPSDYEWPKSWNWKTMPESVNGRCNMLDIPINLRYDVALPPQSNGLPSSRWFVGGGVTTYIMKQEKYVYKYPATAYINPTTPRELNKRTGMYGFSHLNLSAGYERALSRRLSWQVEPFAKVPLKGVGFFKVNLLSTGAFFSLRYKL